jgi:hypothetical protein
MRPARCVRAALTARRPLRSLPRVAHDGWTRAGAGARGAALAWALAACGSGPPSAGTPGITTTSTSLPAAAPPSAPPPPPCQVNRISIGRSDPVVARQIEARGVPPAPFQGRVLYAWVSPSEAGVMRRSRALLHHTRLPNRDAFPFDRQRMTRPSSISALFDRPSLSRRLEAWPNPWGVLPGDLRGEPPFRDTLVRITLRPGAWLASFDAAGVFRFSDLEGTPVAEADVSRAPDRLAAVYHPALGDSLPRRRELLLCNEAMIEAWALDTEEVRADRDASLDLLRRLRAAVDPGPYPLPPSGSEGCGQGVVWEYDRELTRAYDASVSDPGSEHRLSPGIVDAFVTTLAGLPPGGPPFRHPPGTPGLGTPGPGAPGPRGP